MRGEHASIVMPMAVRRRDQRGEAVEQFEWSEGELGCTPEIQRAVQDVHAQLKSLAL
jgi:hypothetical protein